MSTCRMGKAETGTRRRVCKSAAAIVLMTASSSCSPAAAFFGPVVPSARVAARPSSSSAGVIGGGSSFVPNLGSAADLAPPRRSGGDAQLSMSASPAVVNAGVGAIAGCLTGGLFAGGLHAIAGPDHLAALLPRCCGQRWYRAGRIGALWGMGHGFSATLLGVLAFALKNRMSKMGKMSTVLSGASSFMELAVGASLIFIGILGMKEAREWSDEIEGAGGDVKSLSAAAADDGVKVAQKRAVVFNGVLHGFSWDGAPSLAPAIAVATWRGNISFLLAYALGTMGAMAVTTTLIGEGTRQAGELLHRPDIPQKLSFFSSIVALVVGAVWCGLALK